MRKNPSKKGNSHDGGLARAVPAKQTRHFALAEFHSKIVHGYDVAPLGVIDLPDTLELHPDLLLGDVQAARVAVVVF